MEKFRPKLAQMALESAPHRTKRLVTLIFQWKMMKTRTNLKKWKTKHKIKIRLALQKQKARRRENQRQLIIGRLQQNHSMLTWISLKMEVPYLLRMLIWLHNHMLTNLVYLKPKSSRHSLTLNSIWTSSVFQSYILNGTLTPIILVWFRFKRYKDPTQTIQLKSLNSHNKSTNFRNSILFLCSANLRHKPMKNSLCSQKPSSIRLNKLVYLNQDKLKSIIYIDSWIL